MCARNMNEYVLPHTCNPGHRVGPPRRCQRNSGHRSSSIIEPHLSGRLSALMMRFVIMRDSDIVFRPHRLDRVHHTHSRQVICYLSARRLRVDATCHPIRVFKSRCVCPGAVAFFLIGRNNISTHNCHDSASNVFGL